MATQTKKTKRALSSSDEEGDSSSNTWPRFIIIKSTEGTIPKNPFLLAKTIQSIAGEVKSVKHLRDGNLLVECVNKKQSTSLLKLTAFAGIPVHATSHKTLNSSKGTIRDTERILQGVPEEEILEGLSSQGVTHVKRFMRKRDGNTIPLNTYLLTFSSAILPPKIKAGFNVLPVQPFIPNALRSARSTDMVHSTAPTVFFAIAAAMIRMLAATAKMSPNVSTAKANMRHLTRSAPFGSRRTKSLDLNTRKTSRSRKLVKLLQIHLHALLTLLLLNPSINLSNLSQHLLSHVKPQPYGLTISIL